MCWPGGQDFARVGPLRNNDHRVTPLATRRPKLEIRATLFLVSMSGFDAGRVYSTQAVAVSSTAQAPDAPVQNETALFEFVQNFRLGAEYIYRDRLRSNLLVKQYVLDVQLEHI